MSHLLTSWPVPVPVPTPDVDIEYGPEGRPVMTHYLDWRWNRPPLIRDYRMLVVVKENWGSAKLEKTWNPWFFPYLFKSLFYIFLLDEENYNELKSDYSSLSFCLYWDLRKCPSIFFFFFNVAIAKVSENWKLRFDYNAFLISLLRCGAPLLFV